MTIFQVHIIYKMMKNIPGHPLPDGDSFFVSLSQQHPYLLSLQDPACGFVRSEINR